jgi:deoxyhypusine synthase
VTCYVDSTVALPLLTVYALATRGTRKPRRLMERMDELMRLLEEHYHTRSPREKGTQASP